MKAKCERLVQGGFALAHDGDGRVLLVSGALPGEEVEIAVDKRNRSYTLCHAVDILSASGDRVSPSCPYYGKCGGCDLQFLKGEKQAQLKEELVRDNLRRIAGIDDVMMEKTVSSPLVGYRLRCRFHVDLSSRKVGFLSSGSNTLVPLDDCPVLEEPLRELLRDKKALLDAARKAMFRGEGKAGLFTIAAVSGDMVSLGDEVVRVDAGESFAVSASVFFQGNRHVLPAMGSFVKENVVGNKMMDLYSGVGTFSRFVGREMETVLVEREPKCLRLAKINVPWGKPFTADVGKWKGDGECQSVVVDPPRGGLDAGVPSLIASWKPKRLVYMSCDSVTLSRDAKSLVSLGFVPRKLKVFDLYPQTFGQEACLIFDKE